ncbi:MAG: RnfH family protein [Mariprofundus sp.]|nr:RnfH family protein [Mariprofundus sp.]
MIHISVVYALPNEQYLSTFELAQGSTAEQAVLESDLLKKHPEVDLTINKLGIFAKLVKGSQLLVEGDRVEVYRPLVKKPRDAHAVDEKKARIRARKESRST